MIPSRHSAGYTLIEVLVAMTILALSLGVLLQIFSGGLRNISVSGDYARAVLIAETHLDSAGASSVLSPGSSTGITEQKFRWTQTVEDYNFYSDPKLNPIIRAYTVTVDVEWPHADRVRRVTLKGIKLGDVEAGFR